MKRIDKILYVDMDNVLVDFPSAFPFVNKDLLEEYVDNKDDIPGIFSLMEPLDGAIDAYQKLSTKFDTYILSTAPWGNPSAWSDKVVWVKKHLGESAHKRLILSHNKDLNRGEYLIDDRLKNGAAEFKGEHIHFGREPFPDWHAVLAYLL
jgi:5'-nucleotidase